MQTEIFTNENENDDLIYGEPLHDDVINTFCDKLQAVCPKKIDGLLAIQAVMCEPECVAKNVKGENEAIQIFYDRARVHYVMVYFKPSSDQIMFYDSYQRNPYILDEVLENIQCYFSHLFEDQSFEIGVDLNFEQQNDTFSCGYRAIGAVLDLARGLNPANQVYSRRAIFNFIRDVINEKNPDWEMFLNADIHRGEAETLEENIHRIIISPEEPEEPELPSITMSTLSTTSLESLRTEAGIEEHIEEPEKEEEEKYEEKEIEQEKVQGLFGFAALKKWLWNL
ncbi:unnamed protein product [Caenorhabditis angaria]|uniref:Ubiquitin-like protease family profile domain-containing protein n=1 Tax=Caenorhabditis angaria TaxID=860376 RepID=A0A9P1IPT0_9PELO|nr:unnamed protein product [Caenorhabditis angaria]